MEKVKNTLASIEIRNTNPFENREGLKKKTNWEKAITVLMALSILTYLFICAISYASAIDKAMGL